MGKVLRKCVLLACAFLFAGTMATAGHADAKANPASEQLIIINKKTNQLAFFRDGRLEKVFKVATGKSADLTPDGKHKIVNKIKNRPYYKENIPGGDPLNPLGDRWIGLDIYGTKGTTYAIHGNNNSKSIGKYVSAGCIRMYNDEVHWLFDQVKINSYAIIISSKLSFEQIAENNGYALKVKHFDGKVVVNGTEQKLKSSLLLVDARVYVPMRELFELLGGTVQWDGKTKTVTAYVGKQKIVHKPTTAVATVNGANVAMTVSMYEGNTVMLPLRDVSALSKFAVEWDGKANTVKLTSPPVVKQEAAKSGEQEPAKSPEQAPENSAEQQEEPVTAKAGNNSGNKAGNTGSKANSKTGNKAAA